MLGDGDVYLLNGIHHRANGPALMWYSGAWRWELFGFQHRYYGPSVSGGEEIWVIHGRQIK